MQLIPLYRPKSADYEIKPISRVKTHSDFVGGLLVKDAFVVSASEDGQLILSNARTLRKEKTILTLSYAINYIALSPDGSLLAAASDDGMIRLIDTESWRLLHEIAAHSSYVTKVAFNGDELISISKDETIKIWNPQTGELLYELTGHNAWVYSLACSPSGKKLLSTANNCSAKVWNLKHKSLENDLVAGGPLIYGSDGTTLMFGGTNDTGVGNKSFPTCSLWIEDGLAFTCSQDIVCWNTKDWTIRWQEDLSYERIKGIIHLPHYNMLIVVSDIIYGLDPKTGKVQFSQRNTDATPFFSAALMGDDYLLTADENGYIAVWNISELVSIGQKAPFGGDVYKPLYVPVADRIIAGSWLGGVFSIWSKNGHFIDSFKGLSSGTDNIPMCILPKEKDKVIMTGEGELWVVDVKKAKIDRKIKLDHPKLKVTAAIFISDTLFIAACTVAEPRLIDVESGEVKQIQSDYALNGGNYRINEELFVFQLSFFLEKGVYVDYTSDAPIADISFAIAPQPSLQKMKRQAPLIVYNVNTKKIVHQWWFSEEALIKKQGQYAWPIAGGLDNKLIPAAYTEEQTIYFWELGKEEPVHIKSFSNVARSSYSSPYPVFASDKVFVFRLDDDMYKYDIEAKTWTKFRTDGWKSALNPEKTIFASIQRSSELVIYDAERLQKLYSEDLGFELEWVLIDEYIYVYNKNKGMMVYQLMS